MQVLVDATRPTILSFNSVERLLRGDFFHTVTRSDVVNALHAFPPAWRVAGLGTTNWYRRNGEILLDGTASAPRFLWADPAADPPGRLVDLDAIAHEPDWVVPPVDEDPAVPHFPFMAVGVWDPEGRREVCRLSPGADLFAAVETWCEGANIGLAAVCGAAPALDVGFQAMCHIPLGGVSPDRPPGIEHGRRQGVAWEVQGFYIANPTIRALLSRENLALHLHGREAAGTAGGHLDAATVLEEVDVEVWPLLDLVLQVRGLDAARLPVRDVS